MSGVRSFCNIGYLLHYTRPEHSYSPLDVSKPHKHTYTSPISRDDLGQQYYTHTHTYTAYTPTDVPRHPIRLFEDVWRFMLTLNGVCWCVSVSSGVFNYLMLSGDLSRVPEEFLKGYLSVVYGRA